MSKFGLKELLIWLYLGIVINGLFFGVLFDYKPLFYGAAIGLVVAYIFAEIAERIKKRRRWR